MNKKYNDRTIIDRHEFLFYRDYIKFMCEVRKWIKKKRGREKKKKEKKKKKKRNDVLPEDTLNFKMLPDDWYTSRLARNRHLDTC